MSDRAEPQKRRGRKPAEGAKRKFLATLHPEVIRQMKLAAIQDDTSASECLEKAAEYWLKSRGITVDKTATKQKPE